MKKNIIIGQSGGPTAAINASLSGIVRQAMRSNEIGGIYGMLNGIEGLLKRRVIDIRASIKETEDLDRLAMTPSMALESCRYKLKADKYAEVLQVFKDYEIGIFFYIGGNDSMDTVKQLSYYFKDQGADIQCIGVPKTIDNDLPITDHTPGFGSAAKYIAASIMEIALDSSVHDMSNVIVAEIMGRDAGWLTASSALARDLGCVAPLLIYLPEAPFDTAVFLKKVAELAANHRLVIIAVSEGLKNTEGKYISDTGEAKDAFGHAKLSGTGKILADLIKENVKCKVRSIEYSILQRTAGHYTSNTDITESVRIGEEAVIAALRGENGVMLIFERVSDEPYLVRIGTVPVEECANIVKDVPREWIIDGCDVSDELIKYVRPLLSGRTPVIEKDGVPSYMVLDKTLVVK